MLLGVLGRKTQGVKVGGVERAIASHQKFPSINLYFEDFVFYLTRARNEGLYLENFFMSLVGELVS